MKVLRIATVLAIAAAFFAFSVAGSAFAAATTFSTGFQIQNLSSSTANITVSFYASGSGTATTSFQDTISPNGQKTYASLSQVQGLPAGFSGGAVISSDQQVAALVNIIGDGNFNNGASYSCSSQGATSVSLPLLFKNSFNFNSFFNVQNTSSTTVAHVTITYSAGSPETKDIQPNSSERFDQASNSSLPSGFNGSAVVTSDQPVSVAVLENGPTTMLSYNGFASTSTAPIFPLINANNFGFITGISLQNAGTQATNVTVSYTPSQAGTACTETQTIQPKGTGFFALTAFAQSNQGEDCANGATFIGSGKVTTNSANQPLVGVVNQLNSKSNKGGAYNSVDANDGTATVIFPIIQDRLFNYFTGFSIVNVGSVATDISCSYSNTSVKQSTTGLAPGATFTAQQVNQIAANYNGSGVCTATAANAKIIGVLNQVNTKASTDAFFVSNGINS